MDLYRFEDDYKIIHIGTANITSCDKCEGNKTKNF